MLSTLRFILNEAIKGCLIDRNVMLGEIPKPQKTSFVFLESIDLERLKSYEFKKESQRIAADLFVFQCYTGFSYSDLMSFESKQHLIKGTDGKDWIRKRRIKTAVEAHLPLFEEARIILEKYKYELPKMILATYNRLLVRIANELSMSKITSHVARKTACMLFLESGLDFDSIALMVGHSTAETTRNFYAKVRPVRIINQLKDSKLKW
jgi:integrase